MGPSMRPSSWIPPVAWMAVIMVLSSEWFSGAHTGPVLIGLLASVAPWLTAADLSSLHGGSRKLAHFIEYAILALLWFRALVRDRTLPGGLAALGAFGICVAWATIDETHQLFVSSRTGSARDVAIDAAGSLTALAVARERWLDTLRAVTGLLLWLAALGGAAALAINYATGVPSGYLWLTVPAAALLLAARRWWWRPFSWRGPGPPPDLPVRAESHHPPEEPTRPPRSA
jgi:VanZ family protein